MKGDRNYGGYMIPCGHSGLEIWKYGNMLRQVGGATLEDKTPCRKGYGDLFGVFLIG